MPIRTLYIDTSVIGGYHDPEWMAETRALWQQARDGHWRLVTSIIAEAELKYAPANVQNVFHETFGPEDILDTSLEIEGLANAYLAASVVPPKYADDALHVAMATIHGVRLIVSWNFKHLVNVRREDFQRRQRLARVATHPYCEPKGDHLWRRLKLLPNPDSTP